MVANRRARLRLQVNNLNSIGKRRHIQQLAIRRQRNTIRKFKSPRNLPQPGSALLPMPNRPRPRVSQIDVAGWPEGEIVELMPGSFQSKLANYPPRRQIKSDEGGLRIRVVQKPKRLAANLQPKNTPQTSGELRAIPVSRASKHLASRYAPEVKLLSYRIISDALRLQISFLNLKRNLTVRNRRCRHAHRIHDFSKFRRAPQLRENPIARGIQAHLHACGLSQPLDRFRPLLPRGKSARHHISESPFIRPGIQQLLNSRDLRAELYLVAVRLNAGRRQLSVRREQPNQYCCCKKPQTPIIAQSPMSYLDIFRYRRYVERDERLAHSRTRTLRPNKS